MIIRRQYCTTLTSYKNKTTNKDRNIRLQIFVNILRKEVYGIKIVCFFKFMKVFSYFEI